MSILPATLATFASCLLWFCEELAAAVAWAAEVPEEVVDENVEFVVVEEMPVFRNGNADLMRYLSENIKYPTVSAEQGVQGRVVVQFVVGVHGEILNPVVVKSVDPYLDKEAIRVISSMPKWKPGKQRGKAVRVKYTVPVVFRLQS